VTEMFPIPVAPRFRVLGPACSDNGFKSSSLGCGAMGKKKKEKELESECV
jgi:hypothetical protein